MQIPKSFPDKEASVIRNLRCLGVLSGILFLAAGPTAAEAQPSTRRDQRHVELLVEAAAERCLFRWDGIRIDGAKLAHAASRTLHRHVARQGGPSEITWLTTVLVKGDPTTPYRCISAAMREVHRSGLNHVRLMARQPKGASARVVVIELPMHRDGVRGSPLPAPRLIDPVHNMVRISASGQATWNGVPIDLVRLQQYLEVTNTMNPVPELRLAPDAGSELLLFQEVITTIWLARISKLMLAGRDLMANKQFYMDLSFYDGPGTGHLELIE